MALDILLEGSSLDLMEDNQLYDYFKASKQSVEMLMNGMMLKKEPQEFICHCIKVWLGEIGH